MRAVKKADSIDTARKIVRAIVDDPETTLCVKAFYKGLKAHGGGKGKPQGKATFLTRQEAPFNVYVVRLLADGREHHVLITYPTHRCYENGVVEPIPWTAEKLMDAMQRTLREVRASYGGDWWLEIKEPKPDPAPEIGKRALSGRQVSAALADKLQAPAEEAPDGRKVQDMIERMKAADARSVKGSTESLFKPQEPETGPGVPLGGDKPAQVKPEPLPTAIEAGRDMVERIKTEDRPKGKLPEKVSGYPFDPEHDEELQGDL
jgi:hypothetical protein